LEIFKDSIKSYDEQIVYFWGERVDTSGYIDLYTSLEEEIDDTEQLRLGISLSLFTHYAMSFSEDHHLTSWEL